MNTFTKSAHKVAREMLADSVAKKENQSKIYTAESFIRCLTSNPPCDATQAQINDWISDLEKEIADLKK